MGATKTQSTKTRHRRCYFCDGPGPFSKEHAWPQWMKAEADVLPTRISTSIGFERTSDDTFAESPNIWRERQGSALVVQVREVCRLCNSGWMSQLETAARPVLERLWSSQPTKLTSSEAATLARWAIKTTWMHERSRGENPTPGLSQRRAVMEGSHPSLTRVWLGRYGGEHDFNAPILQADMSNQRQACDTGESARAMLGILVFHGVALMVRTDTRLGIPRLQVAESAWRPLAPRTNRGRLPSPRRSMTDDEIRRRLLNHRDWADLPDLSNFIRDEPGWLERPPREAAIDGR